MNPSVSIVTPSYNRAHLLPRLWASIRNQDIDFEWIVVDDCGQDNTAQVLADFNDPRIRYIRLDSNRGSSGARNAGMASARGQFLIFIDDDDEFLPNVLPRMVDLIQNAPTEVGVIGFPEISGNTGRVVAHVTERAILDEKGILCTNALNGAMNFIYRTDIIRGTLFDETLRTTGDLVWLKNLSKSCRFMTINMPTVVYHRHPNSLTGAKSLIRDSQLIAEGHRRILANHADVLRDCPATVTYHLTAALYRDCVARQHKKAWMTYQRLLQHTMAPKDVLKATGILLMGFIGLGPFVDTRRTQRLLNRFGQ